VRITVTLPDVSLLPCSIVSPPRYPDALPLSKHRRHTPRQHRAHTCGIGDPDAPLSRQVLRQYVGTTDAAHVRNAVARSARSYTGAPRRVDSSRVLICLTSLGFRKIDAISAPCRFPLPYIEGWDCIRKLGQGAGTLRKPLVIKWANSMEVLRSQHRDGHARSGWSTENAVQQNTATGGEHDKVPKFRGTVRGRQSHGALWRAVSTPT
jgi:hypothetical protein